MTLKQRKHYAVGIDGGNSDGKGAMVKGKRLVTMTLPSVSTRGDLKALARARVADGSRAYTHLAESLEAEEYLLSYQKPDEQKPTEEYFGKLALREHPYTASSGRGDPSRSWTGRLLKLCFVIAGTLIQDQEAELFLVTGLPTKTFAERTRKQVVESLGGDHTFFLNGRKRRLIIEPEHIRVVQEGAAAAKALAKPVRGFQGTIDPGGYSTEFFVLNDMQVVASMCGGMELVHSHQRW
jgi:Actin like proteins N terminal domain